MTKQEVIAAILDCNEKLGRVPSRNELNKLTQVSRRQIRKHFNTYARALLECRLQAKGGGRRIDMEFLFRDWAVVARKLKKIPTICDYEETGTYSHRPLLTRFGAWMIVPEGMKQFAEEHGLAEEWRDVLEMVDAQDRPLDGRYPRKPAVGPNDGPRILPGRPMYGPLLRPYPLMCGPVNEVGVIYLFGTVAERLGFVVLRVQSEFPDCEALRLVDEERLQLIRIEFEHESKNFLKHRHNVNGCDMIVCWKHNWPECPLEVLELKSVIGENPAFAMQSETKMNLTAAEVIALIRREMVNCQNSQNREPSKSENQLSADQGG